MRCIFFVPRPGTFTGADLARLEAEAASNPGAKGPLLRHLHVRPPYAGDKSVPSKKYPWCSKWTDPWLEENAGQENLVHLV